MNAHTPFDANKDWSNPYCQNKSNDPMVDALLGNAYHVVRTVYCNLGNLKNIYDFLTKYGMVSAVESEAELRAVPIITKFMRIYDKTPAGDRQVTDYLYVDGDRTGILPDDTTATGSWVKVATSGSSNGGGSTSDGGYIPWIYNSGSAIGGETSIRIPDETAGAPFMIVNGDWQTEGYDFEYDPLAFEIKFTTPLEQGDFVVVMRTGVPATPDNPNVSDWVTINWLYNHGAAVGGEQVIDIPFTFQSVPAVYKNGLRFYKGLVNNSYTIDSDNNRIILTEPLAINDCLIVQLGGEANVLEVVDRTIQEVARATNVKDSEVILSTDTTSSLNGKKVVYDVTGQKAYGLPSLPSNVYISHVGGGELTYQPGNVVVQLVPVEGSAEELRKDISTPGTVSIPSENLGDIPASKIIIEPAIPTTKSVPLNVFAEQFVSLLQFPNVVSDGITDTRAAVQAAIDACALAGTKLYIPAGVYAFGNWFSLPSNSYIEFDELAWFKLLNNTTLPGSASGMGGFQIIGYNYNSFYDVDGITPKQVEGVNITTIGMKLDCNFIAGENGINAIYCRNVRHIRPTVKNTRHTQSKLGGRAFQFEGNFVQDVVVSQATVLDCSIGCNSQALAGSTTKITKALVYDGIFMRDVDVPFNIDGQADNPETADANTHSVTVFNAVLHNCGAPRTGFATSLAGGIICGDRGAGLKINGLRVVNDDAYGGIGAIVRGQVFNVQISDADITAPYIVSVVDHNPPGFGAPSMAAFNAYAVMRNVRISANLDYIGRSHSTSVGAYSLELDVDMPKASITNLFDANIAASSARASSAMLRLTNSVNGETTGWRSFRDLFLAGNTPALCMKSKEEVGTFIPTDASGLAAAITLVGTQRYIKDNNTITLWLNFTFPTTTDNRPAAISGLPATGLAGITNAGISAAMGLPAGSLGIVKGGQALVRFVDSSGAAITNAMLSGKTISLVIRYAI